MRMFAASAAGGGPVLLVAAAPVQAALVPGGYTITVAHSGKCLDIRNSSPADGAVLVQNRCDGRPSQRFTLSTRTVAPDQAFLQTFAGKCLTRSGNYNSTVPVTQQPCVNNPVQWLRIRVGHPWPGESILTVDKSGESSFSFHVDQAGTADGAAVITHPANGWGQGSRNDTFTFQPA
ncbi:RICIN domain-containing protein [Streptomyces venezuelae]|uniref:RICIN domain-containing protein n=1 Tax=Streptomyces sp. B6(2022) TaxID=3404749 RepID=UPI00311E57A6